MTAVDALASARVDSAPAHLAAAQIFDIMIRRSANPDRRSLLSTARDSLIAAAFRDPGCSASAFYFVIREMLDDSREQGETLERALAGAPESPALLVGLAYQLHEDGDAKAALDLTQRALEADPAYLPARIAKVWALTTAGRLADAETLAAELAGRYPRIVAARRVAGSMNRIQGRLEAALEHDVAAREVTPNSPFLTASISRTYRRLGDIPTAEQQLRPAIKQWPGWPGLLQEQARCAAEEDRQREARTAQRKATAIILSDARASGEPGVGRRLMVHNLVSWMLARLPDWEVNAKALTRLRVTGEHYKGRDRLPAVGHDRITGMLRALDWDAARSYALADRATSWLLGLLLLAILAAGITAPTWAAQMAGLTKPTSTGTLVLYGLMVLSFVATSRLTASTRLRVDIAITGTLAAIIAAYFAIADRELSSRDCFRGGDRSPGSRILRRSFQRPGSRVRMGNGSLGTARVISSSSGSDDQRLAGPVFVAG